MIYKIMKNDPIRGDWNHRNMFAHGMAVHNDITTDSEWSNYKVLIPKSYARLETDIRPDFKNLENIECYEIRIFLQIGSARNKRDTFVLCKFPGNDRYFRVNIHASGGASYEKSEHKFILRVTDELDRRIVLGFCQKYYSTIIHASYTKTNEPNMFLQSYAFNYTANQMPIRLKSGPTGNRDLNLYQDIKPYEESSLYHHNIFENVAFMRTAT